jgi:hypothetical protein
MLEIADSAETIDHHVVTKSSGLHFPKTILMAHSYCTCM